MRSERRLPEEMVEKDTASQLKGERRAEQHARVLRKLIEKRGSVRPLAEQRVP